MTEMDERHKWYLYDLGFLLKEYALRAKADYDNHRGHDSESFYLGEFMAYSHVISVMQQQAKVFDIPLEDLRLADIDPDKDL